MSQVLDDSGSAAEEPTPNEDGTTDEQTNESSEPGYAGTKHRVKVDGEEIEVPYEDLVDDYQRKQASYKRMEDASKLKKQIEPLLKALEAARNGDASVLKKLGIPRDALRKFSEETLLEALEEEDWSEDKKERVRAEKERDKVKAEKEALEQRELAAYQQHLQAQAADKIQSEMTDAFKELGISMKGNARLIARTAEVRLLQRQQGKEITMTDALKRSLTALDEEYREYAALQYQKDPDTFLGSLPETISDGVRRKSLKEVESQLPIGKMGSESRRPQNAPEDDEFREYMKQELQR